MPNHDRLKQLLAILSKALADNNYQLSPLIKEQFIDYLLLLERWNGVFNLTAIRDIEEMIWLHILDSLSVAPFLQGNRLLDVGSGAGLPGIPLAIINPQQQFVLLDSNSKKTRFLTQVVLELELKNVEVIHARCEAYKPFELFDSILSRAFSQINLMISITQHLLAKEGQFLAMKGIYPKEELQQMPKDYRAITHSVTISGLNQERHIVCIKRM